MLLLCTKKTEEQEVKGEAKNEINYVRELIVPVKLDGKSTLIDDTALNA